MGGPLPVPAQTATEQKTQLGTLTLMQHFQVQEASHQRPNWTSGRQTMLCPQYPLLSPAANVTTEISSLIGAVIPNSWLITCLRGRKSRAAKNVTLRIWYFKGSIKDKSKWEILDICSAFSHAFILNCFQGQEVTAMFSSGRHLSKIYPAWLTQRRARATPQCDTPSWWQTFSILLLGGNLKITLLLFLNFLFCIGG